MVRRVSLAAPVAVTLVSGDGNRGLRPHGAPGPPVPGGFSIVIASKTFGPAGGNLSAKVGKTRLRLHVNRGALNRKIVFTFTRPRLGNLRNRLPRGTVPHYGNRPPREAPERPLHHGEVREEPCSRHRPRQEDHEALGGADLEHAQEAVVRYGATITAGKTTFVLNRIHEFVVTKPK